MNQINCIDGSSHQNGLLWSINEESKTARKFCPQCQETILELPLAEMEKEFQELSHKQKEANLFFKAFTKVDNEDKRIIGYLNLILEDYIDFLGKNNLNLLISKMIELAPTLDEQNTKYITKMCEQIYKNDIDARCRILEQFQAYNASYLTNPLKETESNKHHL